MKIAIDKGAFSPERAHPTDAGMDLRSPMDAKVFPHNFVVIDTGVHVELPAGYAGVLMSKSGLNVMHDITSTGLIDEGYTGSICVKLYNHGDRTYIIHKGDKISQLMVVPVRYEEIEIVECLDTESERGDHGFGSTGK